MQCELNPAAIPHPVMCESNRVQNLQKKLFKGIFDIMKYFKVKCIQHF